MMKGNALRWFFWGRKPKDAITSVFFVGGWRPLTQIQTLFTHQFFLLPLDIWIKKVLLLIYQFTPKKFRMREEMHTKTCFLYKFKFLGLLPKYSLKLKNYTLLKIQMSFNKVPMRFLLPRRPRAEVLRGGTEVSLQWNIKRKLNACCAKIRKGHFGDISHLIEGWPERHKPLLNFPRVTFKSRRKLLKYFPGPYKQSKIHSSCRCGRKLWIHALL